MNNLIQFITETHFLMQIKSFFLRSIGYLLGCHTINETQTVFLQIVNVFLSKCSTKKVLKDKRSIFTHVRY